MSALISSGACRQSAFKTQSAGKLRLRLIRSFESFHGGTFTNDAKRVALVGLDKVSVVLLDNGQDEVRVTPANSTILGAAFSPDDNLLATTQQIDAPFQATRFCITLWELPSGKEKLTISDKEDYQVVNDLSFTPDGKLLASDLGGVPRLWRTSDGTEARRFAVPDLVSALTSQRVLLSPDGRRLATYLRNKKPLGIEYVRLWELATNTFKDLPTSVYRGWTFSPDSRLLAVTAIRDKGKISEHSAVEVWDLSSSAIRSVLEVPRTWRGAYTLTFSPDGQTLAIGGYVRFGIFSIDTGELIADGKHTSFSLFRGNEMSNMIHDIEFSPDGKMLLTGGEDNIVKLWSVH